MKKMMQMRLMKMILSFISSFSVVVYFSY